MYDSPDYLHYFLIVLAVGILYLNDRLDRQRIRDHIRSGGGVVLDISLNFFGRGWFFRGGGRCYEVTYRTSRGRTLPVRV
jgi:hypothetical protein